MRWSWAAVLLVLPLTAGCLDVFDRDGDDVRAPTDPADVGYEPQAVEITGVIQEAASIPSFDETPLATVIYRPVTDSTLPDGSPIPWGVVVFLHGWGFFKEQFTGIEGQGAPAQAQPATGQVPYGPDRLQAFAQQGLIAVAYDARGFGQSGGTTTIAGPAEMADLDAVLDYVASRYPTSGRVGLVGVSYGAGQSYQAWADDPRIVTAVPMYGWVDLFEGLAQGGVPKAQWAAMLMAVGTAGGKGPNPILADWLQKAVTRTGVDEVEAEMDLRSVGPRLATVDKPLLVCQGLQETLFPQADLAWSQAGGFTRAIVSTGGHGVVDEVCWSHALDWMLHFLAGHDKGVAGWPALQSVDAAGGAHLAYSEFPAALPRTVYLGSGEEFATGPTNATFVVNQRLLANPFAEPAGPWDQLDLGYQQVPEQFREDPTALFWETAAVTGSEVLLGAPVLRLQVADSAGLPPYQIAGVLYHVACNGDPACARGSTRILSHAAAADGQSESDTQRDVLELRFWWTKADLQPGDRLLLKVGANDPSVWMQYPGNYAVTFTGASSLDLPFYEG